MHPINAINQEFARIVVEEWSEEAVLRQQAMVQSPHGIGAAFQQFLQWVRTCLYRREAIHTASQKHELAR